MPTVKELSAALGVGPSQIRRDLANGMPRDDIEAARQWRIERAAIADAKRAKALNIELIRRNDGRRLNIAAFSRKLGVSESAARRYIGWGIPTDNLAAAQAWLLERRQAQTLRTRITRALGVCPATLHNLLRKGMPLDLAAAVEWYAEYKRPKTTTRLAHLLGIGSRQVLELIARGMPTDPDGARLWYQAHRASCKNFARPVRSLGEALGIDRTTVLRFCKAGMPRQVEAAREWIKLHRPRVGERARAEMIRQLAAVLKVTRERVYDLLKEGMPIEIEPALKWRKDRAANRRKMRDKARRGSLRVVPMERGKTYPNTTPIEDLEAIADLKEGKNVAEAFALLSAEYTGYVYDKVRAMIGTTLPSGTVDRFMKDAFTDLLTRAVLKYDPNKCNFGGFIRKNAEWELTHWLNHERTLGRAMFKQWPENDQFDRPFDPPAEPPMEFPTPEEMGEAFAALPKSQRDFLQGFMDVDSDVDAYAAKQGCAPSVIRARLDEIRYSLSLTPSPL